MRFIFLFIRPFSYLKSIYFNRVKKKKVFKFNKKNLYTWMNLTKKERFDITKRDSENYLIQRKNLLDQIRSEYNILKKEN